MAPTCSFVLSEQYFVGPSDLEAGIPIPFQLDPHKGGTQSVPQHQLWCSSVYGLQPAALQSSNIFFPTLHALNIQPCMHPVV